MNDSNLKDRYANKRRDFNTKKDNHFDKINKLIDGGKYTASMDKHINVAHDRLKKEMDSK